MRYLARWEPFPYPRLVRRNMGQAFNEVLGLMPRNWTDGQTVAVDVSDSEDSVTVKASLPGFKPEDVDISVNDGILTIQGESKQEENTNDDHYYRRELRHSAVSRSLGLPGGIEHEKADAQFANGILTIRFPKTEEAKPRTIKIQAQDAEAEAEKVG